MTRDEINKHPSVQGALEEWRLARAERDRRTLDGRYSQESVEQAEKAARRAAAVYDAAVAALRNAA